MSRQTPITHIATFVSTHTLTGFFTAPTNNLSSGVSGFFGKKEAAYTRPVLAAPRTATVLVVEDDRNLRELYRSALVASRYHVSVAADGLAALTTIERTRPDVVVLDLGLPGVNGWDVYRDLRAQKETETLPIIIVTGHALRDIDRGDIACFLEKPVDPFQLVAAVDDALYTLGAQPPKFPR